MKNGIKIYLLIICFSILFFSCKKEGNPTEVETAPTKDFKVVKTLTIDSKGGTIETENVSFRIPANSLTSATELKILESEKLDITTYQVSNGIQLSGLPKGYNGAVKIKLKHKGSLFFETYVASVQIAKHAQMGINVNNIDYIETKDSSGYLIATRYYENYNNQSKSLYKTTEIQDDIILAKSGLKREFSTNEPYFKIIYEPTNFSEAKVKVLIDALENSYQIFNEIGFDLKNKNFKNYLKVDVCNSTGSYFGYYNRPFPFLFNNSYIFINATKMTDNETIKATATHELFHYIQDLYGVSDASTTYWIQEALSTWSEELVQEDPNKYIPSGFRENMKRTFHGIEAGQNWNDPFEAAVSNKKQYHGYGMSSFIKYMVKNSTSMDKRTYTLRLLNSLGNKNTNLESFKTALITQNFTSLMHDYFDSVMKGEVYGKNNSTSDAAAIRANLSEQQNETKLFDIKTKADSMKNFSVNIENLGATVFKVNLTRDFTKEEILKLKFSTKAKYSDHKYFVYKNIYGAFPVLIKSGQCSSDEVTIQDLKSISEEKHPNVTDPTKRTSLLILITNVDETKDVMGNTNFTLDLKVTQEKIDGTVSLGSATLTLLPAASTTGTVKVQHEGNKMIFSRVSGTKTYTAEVSWLAPPSGNFSVSDGKIFMNQVLNFKFSVTGTGTQTFAGCEIMTNPVDGYYSDESDAQSNEKQFILVSQNGNSQSTYLPVATSGVNTATTSINIPITLLFGYGNTESGIDGKIEFTGAIRKFWSGSSGGDDIQFKIRYTYKD